MLVTIAVPRQNESAQIRMAGAETREGFTIEEVVRRAYQIHREHGGIFGYDFNDWAEAWGESMQVSRLNAAQAEEDEIEFTPERKREVLEPCFGCGN